MAVASADGAAAEDAAAAPFCFGAVAFGLVDGAVAAGALGWDAAVVLSSAIHASRNGTDRRNRRPSTWDAIVLMVWIKILSMPKEKSLEKGTLSLVMKAGDGDGATEYAYRHLE